RSWSTTQQSWTHLCVGPTCPTSSSPRTSSSLRCRPGSGGVSSPRRLSVRHSTPRGARSPSAMRYFAPFVASDDRRGTARISDALTQPRRPPPLGYPVVLLPSVFVSAPVVRWPDAGRHEGHGPAAESNRCVPLVHPGWRHRVEPAPPLAVFAVLHRSFIQG